MECCYLLFHISSDTLFQHLFDKTISHFIYEIFNISNSADLVLVYMFQKRAKYKTDFFFLVIFRGIFYYIMAGISRV